MSWVFRILFQEIKTQLCHHNVVHVHDKFKCIQTLTSNGGSKFLGKNKIKNLQSVQFVKSMLKNFNVAVLMVF